MAPDEQERTKSVEAEEDGPWVDAQRIEGWAGEVRVNLIRLTALIGFYGHHIINFYLIQDDSDLESRFHTSVTAVVLAWAVAIVVLHSSLSRRWVPPALKYTAVIWDIIMVTALLALTGSPTSSLAVLFFLIIATAPLRLSLRLVYVATLGSAAAYILFLCYANYWLELPDEQRLSLPNQIIFLLGLVVAGLLAGQMVRQAVRLVRGYPARVPELRERQELE